MSKSFILFGALCLLSIALTEECTYSHLEYFSEYSLGKLDELNRTFTTIQPKINVKNVTWKRNETATYRITGIKTTFFYRDSKQKAEFIGNESITIAGGDLIARFDFNWEKTGFVNISGNGSAIGDSEEIMFSYNLTINDEGFLVKTLIDSSNVTFGHYGFNLTRVSPPEATDDDRNNIKRLINDVMDIETTVSHELENEIDLYFHYYLGQTLNDEKAKIDEHFTYEYKLDAGKLVVDYTLVPKEVDIFNKGITLFKMAKIKDYTNWTCENYPPNLPLKASEYGGIQEFVTYDVYKNTLKFAIDQGFLDIDLKRANWESRFFQFYAGDLYEVIPKVASSFIATDVILGSCRTNSNTSNVGKARLNHHAINASLIFQCELSIGKQKITGFELNISIIAEGRPNRTHLDFIVTDFSHETKLLPYLEFKIENEELAKHMIKHSLNRLLDHKVLGSGWEFYPRDYPQFMVEDNYTVLYDSTHVESID